MVDSYHVFFGTAKTLFEALGGLGRYVGLFCHLLRCAGQGLGHVPAYNATSEWISAIWFVRFCTIMWLLSMIQELGIEIEIEEIYHQLWSCIKDGVNRSYGQGTDPHGLQLFLLLDPSMAACHMFIHQCCQSISTFSTNTSATEGRFRDGLGC